MHWTFHRKCTFERVDFLHALPKEHSIVLPIVNTVSTRIKEDIVVPDGWKDGLLCSFI